MRSTTEVRTHAQPRTQLWVALASFVVAVVVFFLPGFLPYEWFETAGKTQSAMLLGQLCIGVALSLVPRTRRLGLAVLLGTGTAWIAAALYFLFVVAPQLS